VKSFFHIFLLFTLAVPSPAWAVSDETTQESSKDDNPVESQEVPQPILTDADRLAAAVRTYQSGEAQTAQRLLAIFVNDTNVSSEALRQQARVYLGEVLYLQQNEEEARRVFETVLSVDPSYVMDPFKHPPDVCGFFETIRAYIRPMKQFDETTPAPPPPRSAYIGFGIYHFQHDQRRLGTAFAITQATFATISLAGFAELLENRQFSTPSERRGIQINQGVQWSSTAAFYAIWAWSAIDAQRHWRTNVQFHKQNKRPHTRTEQSIPGMRIELTIPMR
jgi:hypothetical protein